MSSPPHPLQLFAKERLAPRQVLLRLSDPDGDFTPRHTAHGQYALMGWQRDALFPMALASRPAAGSIEVLVGVSTDEEEKVLLERQGPLWASDPQGNGFPLERARDRPLLLFAGGSAIGAIRAVVEGVVAERSAYGPVVLHYGVRHPQDFAFAERFEAWRGNDVEVVQVVSRDPEWPGARGWLQDNLPDELPDPRRALAFVCGRPEMEEGVIAALRDRGLGPERVFRNWR